MSSNSKGPRGEKRPVDVIGNAVHVVKIATGEIEDDLGKPPSGQEAAARAAGCGSPGNPPASISAPSRAPARAAWCRMVLAECFEPGHDCRIETVCALKGIFHQAGGAFFAVLDRYSLADLLRPQSELTARLGIEAVHPQ
jgi:hypothetical protein